MSELLGLTLPAESGREPITSDVYREAGTATPDEVRFSALREEPIMKTDTQLQKDVIGQLEAELGVAVGGIGVSVNGGAVMLSGTAANCTDKYAAERATLRVPGVRTVSQRVRVGEADQHDDDEIAKTIARALRQDASVPANIQATVESGWVTLRGKVASISERDTVLNAVREGAGVERIYNLITVAPGECPILVGTTTSGPIRSAAAMR